MTSRHSRGNVRCGAIWRVGWKARRARQKHVNKEGHSFEAVPVGGAIAYLSKRVARQKTSRGLHTGQLVALSGELALLTDIYIYIYIYKQIVASCHQWRELDADSGDLFGLIGKLIYRPPSRNFWTVAAG